MKPETWKSYTQTAIGALAVYVGSYVIIASLSYREEWPVAPGLGFSPEPVMTFGMSDSEALAALSISGKDPPRATRVRSRALTFIYRPLLKADEKITGVRVIEDVWDAP